jgi:toxin ParE1/3/4
VKGYRVKLTADAEDDLVDIYRYIARHDSIRAADKVLDGLETSCEALRALPERGHVPPELAAVSVTGYREVRFKPYRIIYEVAGRNVLVHCIFDGRRDLRSLLERRLLR